MPKAPAYQWYPGDFRRDPGLQLCAFYVQSVWRAMLDVMHFGEPYGHFTIGGIAVTPEELARSINEPPRRVKDAIEQLERREIFSRTDEGVIYSRRMVRDEALRRKRAAGGILGGNPALTSKGTSDGSSNDNGESTTKDNLQQTPFSLSSVSLSSFSTETDKKQPPLVPPEGEHKRKRSKTAKSALPAGWQATDKHHELAAELGVDVLLEAEHFRSWAEAKGQLYADWDAAFRNWLHNAPKYAAVSQQNGTGRKYTNELPGRGRTSSSTGLIRVGEVSDNGTHKWDGKRWAPL